MTRQQRIAAARAVLPAARPELIAIGDSLYNGTRSLTTGRGLAELSVPVRVAQGLGLTAFKAPDYPRKVIIDLEDIVRRFKPLQLQAAAVQATIADEVAANARAWMADRRWSAAGHKAFDNTAIAGATLCELMTQTAAGAYSIARAAFRTVDARAGSFQDFVGAAIDLYMNLNAAFLLNPLGLPELDQLSQIDLAIARRPRRLIVSIGHNDGVFMRVFLGRQQEARGEQGIAQILPLAKKLAARFMELPDDTDIYFNSLIKPSVTANLGPFNDADARPGHQPGAGKYYSAYYSKLLEVRAFTKTGMRDYDNRLRDLNVAVFSQMQQVMGARASKLHLVDVWTLADGLDSKHRNLASQVKVRQPWNGKTVELRNVPVGYNRLGKQILGGLFSLDNMHLTAPGYQIVANEVLRRIAGIEGRVAPARDAGVQAAFEADTLLTDFPINWIASALTSGTLSYRTALRFAGGFSLLDEMLKAAAKVEPLEPCRIEA